MTATLDVTALLTLMSVPSAITGFCFWLLQKKIAKRDAARDKQEEARIKNELLLIEGVGAAIALGEATAKSVQRLDSKCNGDMKSALAYAQRIKHEQKDFCAGKVLKIFIKEIFTMNKQDSQDIQSIALTEGEIITADTLDELSNGKGPDEDE